MVNLEGLDLLGEIGGVSADADDVANAQRRVSPLLRRALPVGRTLRVSANSRAPLPAGKTWCR
jgi:hypothetical protein